ncbi:related to 2`-hydroxyisoflavone reductase [Phialocephala subalpina]|uniref:Related to 2`-hydroxyisoflavone reductase n=1 Tax=Phialocephala subalpina TaxID=576137 RepID=A0A1L7X080_9HELO|nr:related to 2`-hydroxyisoflavone reductase [Phialocephala subalpina]
MSSPIKNVIIIGASGSIGPSTISSLLSSNFTVSVLTRLTSNSTLPSTFPSTFPSTVTVIRSDYSTPSLLSAFKNQDAVISAIATFSTSEQISIIDAAVQAGVKRFIPSEYGIDTQVPEVAELLPPAKPKQDTVAHLRAKEGEGMSWTAICVGTFFDWTFARPGLQGWNVPARKATIFDGGEYEYEATNLDQIGRAINSVLLPEHLEETKNQYVYVNSFTTTQNAVLKVLEKITGEKFEVEHKTVEETYRMGLEQLRSGGLGPVSVITAVLYGKGGVNNFSKSRGLWNERLGLLREDLEECLRGVVGEFGEVKE